MSTNRKKPYNKIDVRIAQEEEKALEHYFTKRTTRRKTVQVRISEKWHQKIKKIAEPDRIMISFFLDRICEHYFRNYK